MKVNILSNFFVIIAHYRYPLRTHNLIVAVIYNLSNSWDLSAADAKVVIWTITVFYTEFEVFLTKISTQLFALRLFL
ncbi:hypothetical protein NL53_06795 [Vibrio variabilis]|jgi:hypothetical protein|uniref:Uncharacterized protein n=2 Tax=Vibrio TaxID=662 RepID=A0ABR4YDF7_9VIBR|nr:hypothetical protein NL53_06795 [Vibrio variabilis]KHD26664.1 hypothetical protein NM09_01180 [Vibrio caribbeanicus]KHT35832.1 hypothetical protein RJ46_20270 [Vibrio sinaloensis]KIE19177.1 hypothetical protein SE23_19475 [Vibrio sinaloensis]CAK4068559.1 hypothetical protein VDT1_1221 [Vibrio sp. 16]